MFIRSYINCRICFPVCMFYTSTHTNQLTATNASCEIKNGICNIKFVIILLLDLFCFFFYILPSHIFYVYFILLFAGTGFFLSVLFFVNCTVLINKFLRV